MVVTENEANLEERTTTTVLVDKLRKNQEKRSRALQKNCTLGCLDQNETEGASSPRTTMYKLCIVYPADAPVQKKRLLM